MSEALTLVAFGLGLSILTGLSVMGIIMVVEAALTPAGRQE